MSQMHYFSASFGEGLAPRKPLPPSDGLPVYTVITASALTGAGLLTLGIVIKRDS
jgi:hypothetical protein